MLLLASTLSRAAGTRSRTRRLSPVRNIDASQRKLVRPVPRSHVQDGRSPAEQISFQGASDKPILPLHRSQKHPERLMLGLGSFHGTRGLKIRNKQGHKNI